MLIFFNLKPILSIHTLPLLRKLLCSYLLHQDVFNLLIFERAKGGIQPVEMAEEFFLNLRCHLDSVAQVA